MNSFVQELSIAVFSTEKMKAEDQLVKITF